VLDQIYELKKKKTEADGVEMLIIRAHEQKLESFKKFGLYKSRIESEYNKHEAQRINQSDGDAKTTIWVGKHFKPCDHGVGVETETISWCASDLKMSAQSPQIMQLNGDEFKSPLSTGPSSNDNSQQIKSSVLTNGCNCSAE